MKLRRALARAGKWTGANVGSGLNLLFGSRAKGCFGILMYHRVSPAPAGGSTPTWNVTPRRFAQQLEGLIQYGYRFWPLGKLVSHFEEANSIPPKVTAITFDDGYASVYLHAFPVLRRLNLPATVFVTSAFIGSPEPFPFDDWEGAGRSEAEPDAWRPLTWSECGEMEASRLIEIGTHSHTHQDFRGRPEELKEDLRLSLSVINQALGTRPRAFAFPYGNTQMGFTATPLIAAVRESGVFCALNSEIALNDAGRSAFEWRRIEVVQDDVGSTLHAKLQGWYTWMNSAKEVFCRISPFQVPRNRRMSLS